MTAAPSFTRQADAVEEAIRIVSGGGRPMGYTKEYLLEGLRSAHLTLRDQALAEEQAVRRMLGEKKT